MNENNDKQYEEQDDLQTAQTPEEETATPDTNDGQPAADNEEAAPEAEKTDAEKLAEAEAEIAGLKDRLLRQMADFENFRKNQLKKQTELILNGGEKVLTALLPVLDDFQRAQQNMAAATDVTALREGVDLIFTKLMRTLADQGLKAIEAVGQTFDTDFHEAIAMIPAADDEQKGRVVDCVQTGYMLNDKVLRHAKVAVGQ